MNWKRLFAFIFFVIEFVFTVLYFAHDWNPPRWVLGTIFVLITLAQFVAMVKEDD